MGISTKTHKMLWGRSGNRCAFPDCKLVLVMDETETDDPSVIGEESHIVARSPVGPRGESDLTEEQRDMYGNLILLCSVHHKLIDDQPREYSVDRLHTIKRNHEEWVKTTLGIDEKKQRDDELYATYIDNFLILADVENWKAWTSYVFGSDHPRISRKHYEDCRKLIDYILSRVWPHRYPGLESSFFNFKNVMNDLLKVFDEHAENVGENEIWTRKFYKIPEWDTDKYDRLLEKYRYHVNLVTDLTLELTRAANYMFDSIREHLLANFRLEEGVLLVIIGPFMDFTWRTHRVEYRGEERTEFPYPGLKEFMKIRDDRDLSYGTGVSEDYFPPKF